MTIVTPVEVDSQPELLSLSVRDDKDVTETPISSPPSKKPRIYYIDRLRTWLTLLVVIHHCFWVVVAGWTPFYRPWQADTATLVISYMVLSADQAYFMGLFFFLAGLVTGPSLKRKGAHVFLKDRFYRLMIPAILYDFIVFPLIYCFVEATWYGPKRGSTASFGEVWAYYYGQLGGTLFIGNQMWFTATLFTFNLILTGVLAIFNKLQTSVFSQQSMEPISQKNMISLLIKASLLLIVLNYLVRIAMPDGYIWIPVVGNIGFIFQYVVAFIAGLMANTHQFLDQIRKKHLTVTLACSFIFFWVFQLFQTFMYEILRSSMGFYAHLLFITIFEQFFAVFWSYSVLALFKEYQNEKPSMFFSRLIDSAYATYIVHQWIIIPLAVAFAYTDLYPLVVILILAIASPFLSWGAGMLLKAIPGSDIIL